MEKKIEELKLEKNNENMEKLAAKNNKLKDNLKNV
jgi:hypothetical protein